MKDFDPYLKWLGIRDQQRPPNHYRLLGLDLYESDVEIISMAADRQMAYVRTFQTGPHGDHSQQLMNELAAARRCLLNEDSKVEYDRQLKSQLAAPAATPVDDRDLLPPSLLKGHRDPSGPQPDTVSIAPSAENLAGAETGNISVGSTGGRSRKKPSKRSGALAHLIGIVGGGVAAVVVAYWIINSGMLDRFRQPAVQPDRVASQQNSPNQVADKPASNDDQPAQPGSGRNTKATPPNNNLLDTPRLNPGTPKKKPRQPGGARQPMGAAEPGSRRAPPWEQARWPQPPESLLRPKSTLDKLVQRAKVAISQRDYALARKEWDRVKADVQKRNRNIDLSQTVTELETFWKGVAAQSRNVSQGDELDFRGETVIVQLTSPTSITLRYDRKLKRFLTDPSVMDRDLAAALAAIAGYPSADITRLLGHDFAHEQIVLDGNSFFDTTGVADPTNDLTSNSSPSGNSPSPNGADSSQPTATKVAIPDNPSIAKSKKLVKELFPEAYDRSTSYADRAKLAGEMLTSAATTKNQNDQYVLLCESSEIASNAGDINVAVNALNELNKRYEVEYWKAARQIANDAFDNLNSKAQASELQENLVQLTREAVANQQFDDALQFAGKAQMNARRKLQDRQLELAASQLRDHVAEMETILTRGRKALQSLETNPEDKSDNTHAGSYWCFIENDFEQAMNFWQNSNRSSLVAIAKAELGFDPANNNQLAVARQWFELGSEKESFEDLRALRRSLHWFELALEVSDSDLKNRAIRNSIDEIKTVLKKDPLVPADPPASNQPPAGNNANNAIYQRTFRFDNRQTGDSFQVQFLRSGRVRITNSGQSNEFPFTSRGRVYTVDVGTSTLTFTLINNNTLSCRQTDKQSGRVTYAGRNSR